MNERRNRNRVLLGIGIFACILIVVAIVLVWKFDLLGINSVIAANIHRPTPAPVAEKLTATPETPADEQATPTERVVFVVVTATPEEADEASTPEVEQQSATPESPAATPVPAQPTASLAPSQTPATDPVTVNVTINNYVNGGDGDTHPTATPLQPGAATPTVGVANGSTPVVVVTPDAEPCRLDKVNIANEMPGVDFQRIEVGGGHVQHVDFYPRKGVKAVSYIVAAITPPQVPAVWLGFGSIFEATDAASCATFDWVADATAYASARLDSGHSGLVVDLRSGSPVVVANVAGLSNDQIKALLEEHANLSNDANATVTTTTVDSCKATRVDHTPVVGSAWTLSGPSIINFWSNEPGINQAEHKLLLPAGTTVNLLGGGAQYSFPSGCDMSAEFAANTLPEITLAQLQSLGLVK